METELRVLILDDSSDDAAVLVQELRRGGFAPFFERVETAEAMDDALGRQAWDLILADGAIPQFDVLAALTLLQRKGLDLPFIIVSDAIGEDTAAAAMNAGAHDCLMKQNLTRLVPVIKQGLREVQGRRTQRESEDRYRRLIELSPDMLFVQSEDRIVFINTAGAGLLGAAHPGHVIGKPVSEFIRRDYWNLVKDRLRARRKEHKPVSFVEEKLIRLDGITVDVEVAAIPLTYRNKPALQVIVHDITERKRLEQQVRQAQKLEALWRLAGRLAHDLNNLLTVINGHSQLLLSSRGPIDAWTHELHEIRKAGDRATTLARQLLAFSRGQALQPQLLNLNTLIAKPADMLRGLLGKDIRLVTSPDSALGLVKARSWADRASSYESDRQRP